METDRMIEQLYESLANLQKNFEDQIQSLGKEISQARVEYLKKIFDQQKTMLADCLEGVDRNLLDCCTYIEECRRTQSFLSVLNERLSRMGAEPLSMPEGLPPEQLEGILMKRIEHLRSQGRL